MDRENVTVVKQSFRRFRRSKKKKKNKCLTTLTRHSTWHIHHRRKPPHVRTYRSSLCEQLFIINKTMIGSPRIPHNTLPFHTCNQTTGGQDILTWSVMYLIIPTCLVKDQTPEFPLCFPFFLTFKRKLWRLLHRSFFLAFLLCFFFIILVLL